MRTTKTLPKKVEAESDFDVGKVVESLNPTFNIYNVSAIASEEPWRIPWLENDSSEDQVVL